MLSFFISYFGLFLPKFILKHVPMFYYKWVYLFYDLFF